MRAELPWLGHRGPGFGAMGYRGVGQRRPGFSAPGYRGVDQRRPGFSRPVLPPT